MIPYEAPLSILHVAEPTVAASHVTFSPQLPPARRRWRMCRSPAGGHRRRGRRKSVTRGGTTEPRSCCDERRRPISIGTRPRIL